MCGVELRMTVVSGYDSSGKKYYRSDQGGQLFYVLVHGEAGAREKARQAERAVIGRYDLDSTGWTRKNIG